MTTSHAIGVSNIGCYVDVGLKEALRDYAYEHRVPVSEVIRTAIRRELERNGGRAVPHADRR
jgi:hypothetical protein